MRQNGRCRGGVKCGNPTAEFSISCLQEFLVGWEDQLLLLFRVFRVSSEGFHVLCGADLNSPVSTVFIGKLSTEVTENNRFLSIYMTNKTEFR